MLPGSLMNLDWVNPQLTAKAAMDNKPIVAGIKIHMGKAITGSGDMECLKRAVEAAEIAPASQIPQVVSLHDCCAEHGCQWLHYVCGDEVLRKLVSRTGTACRLPSGPRSWHWCGVAEFRDNGECLECTGASLRSRPTAGPGTHPEAIERLVQLYQATGKKEDAGKWRKVLHE